MVRGSKSQKLFATTARVSTIVVQVVVQAIWIGIGKNEWKDMNHGLSIPFKWALSGKNRDPCQGQLRISDMFGIGKNQTDIEKIEPRSSWCLKPNKLDMKDGLDDANM
ncbi:hypothetical protein L484_023496 [Morus notabilis]|uniref:Uncharacterized protein n=1 Tax=Morus notabilis TaxID=981085 RepID=W9RDH9_9ROSA|nr:hypothetical protein L484_023496 [Morus notabilis]